MAQCILLKLGRCLNAPTKRMLRDFRETAIQCNQMRTLGVRWLMDTCEKSIEYDLGKLTGLERIAQREKIIVELSKLFFPSDNPRKPRKIPKKPDTRKPLVHGKYLNKPYLTGLFPQVSSAVVASCAQDCTQMVSTKMPWGSESKAQRVWQGILLGDVSYPRFATGVIPVPAGKNQVATITWQPSGLVLDFPLFSRGSGRKNQRVQCLIETRQLSEGNRRLIQQIVRQPQELFRDSQLVFKKRRGDRKTTWYLAMSYVPPWAVEPMPEDRLASLMLCGPGADQRAPFKIVREGLRDWTVGGKSAKFIAYKEDYWWRLRKVLALRYRDTQRHTRNGRGREEFFRKIQPHTLALKDARTRYRREVFDEIVKYCRRERIGTLEYWEPGSGLRKGTWFSRRGLPFAWQQFRLLLVAKLESIGCKVVVRTERLEKWAERCGVEKKVAFAREYEPDWQTRVASVDLISGEGRTGHQAGPLATSVVKRTTATGADNGGAAVE